VIDFLTFSNFEKCDCLPYCSSTGSTMGISCGCQLSLTLVIRGVQPTGMFHSIDVFVILFIGGGLPLPLLWASTSMAASIHVRAAFTTSLSPRGTIPVPATRTRLVLAKSFWGKTGKRSRLQKSATSFTERAMSSSFSSSSSIIPRAAVSVVVQCYCQSNDDKCENGNENDENNIHYYYYLLVQRGKEPNKGKWSLPGGKIEPGETTLQGAIRELGEETKWPSTETTTTVDSESSSSSRSSSLAASGWERSSLLHWYPMPITVSDSIGQGFHYVIAQCFAELSLPSTPPLSTTTSSTATTNTRWPPSLLAADDAARADWFTLSDIQNMEQEGRVTPGVSRVVARAKELSQQGLLPTVPAQQLL
jgi:ADP-ribose pyrophosphatase YjhB (NUDIX family)